MTSGVPSKSPDPCFPPHLIVSSVFAPSLVRLDGFQIHSEQIPSVGPDTWGVTQKRPPRLKAAFLTFYTVYPDGV